MGDQTYLTEYGEFIVWQESISIIEQEVPTNELLKTPILSRHKPVRSLRL